MHLPGEARVRSRKMRRVYSPKKLRNTHPRSQISPKTTPITTETRNISSGRNSNAKKMNSPGPLESDSVFLIVQPSALIDAAGRAIINPRMGDGMPVLRPILHSANKDKTEGFCCLLGNSFAHPTPLVEILLQTKA